MVIDLQNSDAWKSQLTIVINNICSKDAEEERVIHSRNNNVKLISYNDANEVVDELFESHRSRYQRIFKNINEREDHYFRLSSTVVL